MFPLGQSSSDFPPSNRVPALRGCLARACYSKLSQLPLTWQHMQQGLKYVWQVDHQPHLVCPDEVYPRRSNVFRQPGSENVLQVNELYALGAATSNLKAEPYWIRDIIALPTRSEVEELLRSLQALIKFVSRHDSKRLPEAVREHSWTNQNFKPTHFKLQQVTLVSSLRQLSRPTAFCPISSCCGTARKGSQAPSSSSSSFRISNPPVDYV